MTRELRDLRQHRQPERRLGAPSGDRAEPYNTGVSEYLGTLQRSLLTVL